MGYQRISIETDDDGHTYIIPYEMSEEFSRLCWPKVPAGSDEFYVLQNEFISKFEGYSIGGGLSNTELYIKKEI